MKKIIKSISAFMVLVILISWINPSSNCVVNAKEELAVIEGVDIEFIGKQAESIEQYQNMLAEFNYDSKVRMNGQQVYDSNYGGAYIDNTGDLVVLLVECEQEDVNEIRRNTKNDEIKTVDCEYSFNELLGVISAVNDNLGYLLDNGIIISEMYEDIYNNNIKIGVKELTKEKEQIIRSLIDSPCMEIYSQDVEDELQTEIRGGYEITSTSGGASTLGFCATRGGVEGFVIAGHAGPNLYDNFTYAGTTVGYVTATAYYNRTTADAAFLTKSQYVETSAKISAFTCHSVATSVSEYPVGTLVYKYGISTGQTSGYVESNYYTSYADNKYFLSQTTTTYQCEPGDSGGPVYVITDVVNG